MTLDKNNMPINGKCICQSITLSAFRLEKNNYMDAFKVVFEEFFKQIMSFFFPHNLLLLFANVTCPTFIKISDFKL